jgi:phage portal protein BeeE
MVADVARYFGIPARLVNAPSIDSMTYKNAEEENLDMLHYTLQNYILAIEEAITDLLPGMREMKIMTAQLTEAAQLNRYTAYNFAVGGPWMSAAEAREMEGLPPQEAMTMMGAPDDDSQRPMTMPDTAPSAAVVAATTGRPAS